MNLRTLLKRNNTNKLFDDTLIPHVVIETQYPFLVNYDMYDYSTVDLTLLAEYGNIKVIDITSFDYQQLFVGFIRRHSKQLKHIYDAYLSEYDMFENFNTTRTILTENGTRKQTSSYGEVKHSNNYGDKTNESTQDAYNDSITHGGNNETITHGAYTDSTQYGQQKTTDVLGVDKTTNAYTQRVDTVKSEKTKDTNTHKVNGNDGGLAIEYQDDIEHDSLSNGENTTGAHTDTITIDSKTNTSTKDSYTDTNNVGAHTDTTIKGEYTDTNSVGVRKTTNVTHKYTDTVTQDAHTDTVTQDPDTSIVTENFKGNQGVSITNQTLIDNELELWKRFDFYEIMMKMWLVYISKGVWE